jgi:signal transduction histidine kinase
VKTDAEPAAPIKNDYEFRIRHKDGGWRWFITHSTIIRDEQGEVIDGIGIAHDVTEIKQVLQNLEKTNQELRETQAYLVQSEKMASLGMLVAGIAHEINTPIGAINSMHDTLVRGVKKLETTLHSEMGDVLEKHESLTSALEIIEDANRIIKSGSERVSKIVKRLRSFARLDEADLKKADIHEGLDDTLALLHHELKHAIELEKHYGDIPRFSFYPGRLNQVFLNLLVNARQAIPDKGKIIITTYTRDNRAYIEIKDTGQGISKQHLQRIFDPGFTTKGVGVGTGLGLSICYQIIRDHKGEIIVDSKEGVGTTFTVIIPMDLDRNTPTSSQQ